MPDTAQWPKTIDDAVERILASMSEEEKSDLRDTHKSELINWHNAFESLFFLNDPDEASGFIIEEAWKRLNSNN